VARTPMPASRESLPASGRDASALPSVTAEPLLGVPLALTDYDRTLDWIDRAVAAGHRGYICVAATHTVMAAREDPDLLAAVLAADFTVPDGQPLVWALNLLGHRLGDRVYGPDLMDRACARAARTGLRFYLYGGRNQGALAQLARNLRLRHPGLRIVGGHVPAYREPTPAEEERVAADIRRSGADVVWVGIGVPKQEKWMARMRPRLDAPVLIGVGAAFDFHAGLIAQAPDWMQRLGLEWLFRLAQEPRRLWRRYLRYNPRFVIGFARQYLRHLRDR
jgi:N-acetylglucosaminyldiphosphoundecaprenol N-acetyl-beta-D-mannosaminyltransferase